MRAFFFLITACLVVFCAGVKEVPSNIHWELNRLVCSEKCNRLENCTCENSEENHREWTISATKTLREPKLLCREDTILAFEMDSRINTTYLCEYKTRGENVWRYVESGSNNPIIVKNLQENTDYKLRVWAFVQNFELFAPSESRWFTTLTRDHTPKTVPSLWLRNFTVIEGDYTAVINWKPTADKSCYYEFVWYGGDEMSDYTQKEITDPATLYELRLPGLAYDSNYSIGVMAKSPDWQRESEKTWLHFGTRPCLEMHRGDSNVCPPLKPEGLKIASYEVSRVINGKHKLYNIVLTWNAPKYQPGSYTAVFRSIIFKTNNSVSVINVSGDATQVVFGNVDTGAHFQVSLTAHSLAGSSPPGIIYRESYTEALDSNAVLTACIVVAVFALLVLVASIIYLRLKRERREEVREFVQEVELKSLCEERSYCDDKTELFENYKDNWEIEYCNLKLLSILGRGAFGVVRKAVLTKGTVKTNVAVKMLRDETYGDEVLQFKQEIDILKSVGRHPHIVSMVGCCTRGPIGPMLVVEYCGKGDLLSYLRNICENMKFCESEDEGGSGEESGGINFANQTYQMTNNQDVEMLEVKDLLSIGRQVATGMEYLSSVKVVHRDLAARNVLICDDGTVKVSDFGLSRDVYRDNVYCKLGAGKLPLRWMAIESLTHQRYTSKSDVWSFGVLLWEIFTLGGNPYPNIGDTYGLLQSLKAGERMCRPENCSHETYNLMLKCWKEHPKDRPTFAEIKRYLEALLENTVDYLDLCFDETALDDLGEETRCKNQSENHYIIP